MEAYGKILLIAMPIFFFIVLLEKWYSQKKGMETVRFMDMVSSLTSGVTNVTKDVLGLSVALISYEWLVNHFALTSIKSGIITYAVVFVVLDFAGYVVHSLNHRINFFWNSHLIHHSSEEFNLACALRQSISVFVRLFVILLLPAALLGVPKEVIAIVAPLHLFAQFWYHTRHIGKMGFLEKFLVTPSHHRVHHAINPEYMDKNFGQIFIVWDKLFGTFQEELKNVPAVYGVTRPVRTWNPIKINFLHLGLLIKDAWKTKSLKDKLRIWFMPTGWRPSDMEQNYPLYKIEDVYNFQKYDTSFSSSFRIWVWIQLISLLLFVSYLFGNIAVVGSPDMFIYGLFIFSFVYALTDMMDGYKYAFISGILFASLGLVIIFIKGDWFGISSRHPSFVFVLASYFLISAGMSILFAKQTIREKIFSDSN